MFSPTGLKFLKKYRHKTGVRVVARRSASARAKAYVSAIGLKSCPSGPDIVKSGMKAHTMINVEKSRARSISCEARRIRSRSEALHTRRWRDGDRCSRP